jgi:hypothetical protein
MHIAIELKSVSKVKFCIAIKYELNGGRHID